LSSVWTAPSPAIPITTAGIAPPPRACGGGADQADEQVNSKAAPMADRVTMLDLIEKRPVQAI
jgi:hypothetical protein